jgi:serine/threonine protein kinase
MRRFEQEALATAALNHPNILAVFDIGTSEGSPVVSELLERDASRAPAQRVHRSPESFGLCLAHSAWSGRSPRERHHSSRPQAGESFPHEGWANKILDFGLAKLTQAEPGAHTSLPTATHGTEAGVVLGTAGYMSPEQVRGLALDAPPTYSALGQFSTKCSQEAGVPWRDGRGHYELDSEGGAS